MELDCSKGWSIGSYMSRHDHIPERMQSPRTKGCAQIQRCLKVGSHHHQAHETALTCAPRTRAQQCLHPLIPSPFSSSS